LLIGVYGSGSVHVAVDSAGSVQDYYDYYPFGLIQRSKGICNGVRFKYTGKELDKHTGYYYFGARYYDAGIGRWLSMDPAEEKYPGLSPYGYCAGNPVRFVDTEGKDWYDFGGNHLEWREGSGLQLKPGFWNWIKNLIGKGEYAESLGENVLLGRGSINEKVNEAKFELYLESNKEGPIATIKGNTIPSDKNKYATIAEGLYSAELTNYKGNPALLINEGGIVPTVFPNPNPESAYYGKNFANEIYFHAGNKYRERLWYSMKGINKLLPISKGCQTGFHGNFKDYLDFMRNFQKDWKGNYYLVRK